MEVVNKVRKRKEVISKLITDIEWLDHFINQFGGDRGEPGGREEGIRKEFEGEIKEEEVYKVVKKLKNRKAPGEDKIKNEAWGKLKGPLTYCMSEVWKKGKMPEKEELKRYIRKVIQTRWLIMEDYANKHDIQDLYYNTEKKTE